MRYLKLSLLALALVGLCGCGQSMGEKGRIKPLQRDMYFENGSSAREPVAGTIPRGELKTEVPYFTGVDEGGKEVDFFPLPVSRKTFEDGRRKFDIFCSVCHGLDGQGKGTIVRRGFAQPPTYHSEKLRKIAHGHLFKVMTRGFGDMPSYDDLLSAYDRWAVAAYIRALERSQRADIKEAPPRIQEKLDGLERDDEELPDE